MPEKTKKWLDFEKQIDAFLRRAGFSDVEHNVSLKIEEDSRYQIDLICGVDSHVLIIDCKLKEKDSASLNIKKLADGMNGRRKNFERIVKLHPKYNKYSTTHLVLALSEGIEPTEAERKYAKQLGVSLWDNRLLSYYDQYPAPLRQIIPYHILADMGAKIPEKTMSSVVAFRSKIKIGTHPYESFIFSASPSELLKYCYVARREHGGKEFYQRIINTAKLHSVGAYINEGGSFVNDIVLAYDPGDSDRELSFTPIHKDLTKKANDDLIGKLDNPEYNLEIGILQFPLSYKSFWVIDGQHRLFGYTLASKKIQDGASLPVVLIKDIPLKDQMKLFVDINQKQKAINADLIWDIYGDIEPETIFGAISNLAKEADSSGPLSGRIKIPSKRPKADINLSAFCRAIKKTGLLKEKVRWITEENPIYSKDGYPSTAKKLIPVLNDFISALGEELTEEQYEAIISSTSIEIFIALFSLVIGAINTKDSSEKRKDNFAKLMRPLMTGLDEQRLKNIRKATGEALKDDQTKDLLQLVAYGSQNEKLKKLLRTLREASVGYAKLEVEIRNWIRLLFERYSESDASFESWLLKGCPEKFDKTIYATIIRNHKNQDRYKGSERSVIDFLTLGNMLVLLRENNIREMFNACRKEFGTLSPHDVANHLNIILPHRNSETHTDERGYSPDEMKQVGFSIEILMKSVETFKSHLSGEESSEEEGEFSEKEEAE